MTRKTRDSELPVARQVMAELLPHQTPVVDGFDIAAVNETSYEVGGDYYEFIPLGDSRWGIVVADVVGPYAVDGRQPTRSSAFPAAGIDEPW